MWRRTALLLFLLWIPTLASAQDTPVRYLPSGCQLYLQWDGCRPHHEALKKSAIGKMLAGDTGKFLVELGRYAKKVVDKVGQDADPQAAELIWEALTVFGEIGQDGFLVGVEVKSLTPPQVEAMLVFPNLADRFLPLMEKILQASRAQVQQTKVEGRTLWHANVQGMVHFGWWKEGKDVVLTVGTQEPEAVVKRVAGGDAGLTKNPLYKKLKGFQEFATWGRGFFDMGTTLEMVQGLHPAANKIIGELGLNGITSVTFVSGFDGPAERSVAEIHTAHRKGLLQLLNRKTIGLKDLPPLPADATGFSASNFNLGSLYKALLQVAEAGVKTFAPEGEAPEVKEIVRQFEGVLGVSFTDLFDSFDDLSVQYSSPAEGPLGLGTVMLFKVKDEKKLTTSLDALLKAIPPLPFFEVQAKRTRYHGGEVVTLLGRVEGQGEFGLLTYSVHKGWLLVANYPQPMYGFILRSRGELPTWKMPAEAAKVLKSMPQETTAISVSDPRPAVKGLLSLAPGLFYIANTIVPQVAKGIPAFDLSVIPHAEEATRHLFPNVTVTTDDGKTIRIQSRSSLALPLLN